MTEKDRKTKREQDGIRRRKAEEERVKEKREKRKRKTREDRKDRK